MRPDFWSSIDVAMLDRLLAEAAEALYLWDVKSDTYIWSGNAGQVLATGDGELPDCQSAYVARIGADDVPARALAFAHTGGDGEVTCCEYKFRRADGSYEWLEERAAVERDGAGKPLRVLGRVRAVGDQRAQTRALETLAYYDDLTGLLNRRRLLSILDAVISGCRDRRGHAGYVIVGIDRLGGLNSAYGFDIADAVIVDVAGRIEACMEQGDTVGRIGGNQFGVVLSDADASRMKSFAHRILTEVRAREIATGNGPVAVSVSIGGVCVPDQAECLYEAVGRAEEALSLAKSRGRDRFVNYRHSKARVAARQRTLASGDQVLTALRDGRLTYAVQPIVDGHDGTPRFYECLMRMLDQNGKEIPAGMFLPAVEQLGLIRKLDLHTIEQALAELESTRGVNLAVNISGMTATDPAMLSQILSMVNGHHNVADRLTFEITETVAMLDFDETVRFVARLRDLGCRVAIDDFGAGYTSFRHLKHLVVDMVKIDGQFVRGIASNSDDQLFVDTLLELARGLGVEVVAECVETEAQATALRQRGVDYLQGYLFGAPTLVRPWQTSRQAMLG